MTLNRKLLSTIDDRSKMAGRKHAVRDLAFFCCQCRGVKFYGLSEGGDLFGSKVRFKRRPSHPADANCVEVMVVQGSGSGIKLGNLAAEAAQLLSPMLLGPLDITG